MTLVFCKLTQFPNKNSILIIFEVLIFDKSNEIKDCKLKNI